MMTPDPRLSDLRSRGANTSLSPKKYRKNSSSGNGDVWRDRTTVTEEMLATPLTAWAATRVKSGPPLAAETGAFAAARDGSVGRDWALRVGAASFRSTTPEAASTSRLVARESAAMRM